MGQKKYRIFTNNSHFPCIGIVCYGYNYTRILLLLPLPLTMYARPCECQHKIEEDYLFAFTSRLRQAHGKQVFVCTVQLVQKQAQFAQKTGAICTKSNVICTERSPLISKTRCHSAMCHIVQLHTVTQLRWGNRMGTKRGF